VPHDREYERGRQMTGAVSRRKALMAGLILPFALRPSYMAAHQGDLAMSDVVADLIERAERTNAAFISGDMQTWVRLLGDIPPDFTLMQPTGGPASRGFRPTPERLVEMARYSQGGRATLEVGETYATYWR
jgi:hypothetical protein